MLLFIILKKFAFFPSNICPSTASDAVLITLCKLPNTLSHQTVTNIRITLLVWTQLSTENR